MEAKASSEKSLKKSSLRTRKARKYLNLKEDAIARYVKSSGKAAIAYAKTSKTPYTIVKDSVILTFFPNGQALVIGSVPPRRKSPKKHFSLK